MKKYKYELPRNPDKMMSTLFLGYGLLGTVNDREFGEHNAYTLICTAVALIESKLTLTFDEFKDQVYRIMYNGEIIRLFPWHEAYRDEDYNRYFRPELMESLPDAS